MGLLKWFLPEQGSTLAPQIDSLILFITIVSIFFFVLIVALGVYFGVKYRRKKTDRFTSKVDQNHALEITWTVIPSIILFVMFVWGLKLYMNMSVVPSNAMQVKVMGQKWFWTFSYDNGFTSTGEMVVPVNTPVKVLLSSKDVLHSFFVPAFRAKRDAVPNRYTTLWFNATKEGTYPVYCAEYCGTSHSTMLASIKVVPKEDFEAWLKESAAGDDSTPLNELGRKVYEKNACVTCHSLDGTRLVGPSWKGIWNAKRPIVGGAPVLADENYLRESILEPMAKVTEGYPPAMPTYKGILSDREIEGVIAFIKELKE